MERKTVIKLIPIWNFDLEEKWLNEMADQGWKLTSVGFCKYNFIECDPGEYSIRLQLDEATIMDPSVEHIDHFARWHYYAKRTEDGPFELMNDLDSKINHLTKVITLLKCLCLANFCIGLANSLNSTNIGWINLICATIMAYGWGRIEGKKEALEKDRFLFE